VPAPDRHEPWLKEHELLGSFFNLYRRCGSARGQEVPEWHELDEEHQAAFTAAFRVAHQMIEQSAEESVPVGRLAARAHGAFQQVLLGDLAETIDYDEQAKPGRLLWEHLVRHLFNMMEFDRDEDGTTDEHEERMTERFTAKLAEASEADAGGEHRR
jgi:hypothetical protein